MEPAEDLIYPQIREAFKGARVFVTGHTGFKGSWLVQWLMTLGARVTGFALAPPTSPSLFDELGLASDLQEDVRGDIRDPAALRRAVVQARPDFVFHLAAQPIVRISYDQPLETLQTNAMGSANVLDALRACDSPVAAIMATSDKCYENREWVHGYRETDELGGHDPYSASKACAEIIAASYRRSIFPPAKGRTAIATVRAGNVIGGGDWAPDRLVPDCMRSLQAGEPIPVRNRWSTRPWQHVLEPLSGYLLLAAEIRRAMSAPDAARLRSLCSAFNFGPRLESNRTAEEIVTEALKHWPGQWVDRSDPAAPHEQGKLSLAWDKSFHLLGWRPRWDFETTIRETVSWYLARHRAGGSDRKALRECSLRQIREFSAGPSQARP